MGTDDKTQVYRKDPPSEQEYIAYSQFYDYPKLHTTKGCFLEEKWGWKKREFFGMNR